MKLKRRSFQGLLVAGCMLAAVLTAVAAGFTAHYMDDLAIRTQFRVAESELRDHYENLQGRLISRAYRDNTYSHVVLHWDDQWITREMTNYLPSLGIYRVAIFDAQGVPRFIGQNWSRVQASADSLTHAEGMAALLNLAPRSDNLPPQVNRGLVIVAGKAYFAVAAEILPVQDPPESGSSPYRLVFFQPAEGELFHALAIGFRAKDVQVLLQPESNKKRVSIVLPDAAGQPLAYLSWWPQRPGTHFLWIVLPVLFAIFILLTGLLIYFVARWQKAQTQLLETEARDKAIQEEIRVKAIFIGNISHELRTPLNAILGFAEMLQMQVFGALGSARYKEYVDHIIASGHELLRMVNDLIEIARIRSRDTAKEREAIDAAAMMLHVLDKARDYAEKKRVRLSVGSCAANAWCLGSELSLNTALTKMVDNAISVTDREKSVEVEILRKNGRLRIAVSDHGTPTPDDMLARVNGDLFMFSGDHLTAQNDGTGLNFEIAKGLAKLMGGSLQLIRVDGVGNRAELDLPLADAPDAADVPDAIREPP